jgi:hypothetical protein
MVSREHLCQIKFAFDLPDSHPAFDSDWGDDLLFQNVDSLNSMDDQLEFSEVDYGGAKMVAVFEFDGDPKDVEEAYYEAKKWLNEFYYMDIDDD